MPDVTRAEFDMLEDQVKAAHDRLTDHKKNQMNWIRVLIALIVIPGLTGLYAFWGTQTLAKANKEAIEEREAAVNEVPKIVDRQRTIIDGINYIGKIAEQQCRKDPQCELPEKPIVRPARPR